MSIRFFVEKVVLFLLFIVALYVTLSTLGNMTFVDVKKVYAYESVTATDVHKLPRVNEVDSYVPKKTFKNKLERKKYISRSEERRVGKECRSRWWQEHGEKKKKNKNTDMR